MLQGSLFLQTKTLTSSLLRPSPHLGFGQFKANTLERLWETIEGPSLYLGIFLSTGIHLHREFTILFDDKAKLGLPFILLHMIFF